jgi:hypothetical protein
MRGSPQLFQLRLHLLHPEPHLHLAIHRRSRGQVLVGVLPLARAPVQRAEAEVAVSEEGAHADIVGELNPAGPSFNHVVRAEQHGDPYRGLGGAGRVGRGRRGGRVGFGTGEAGTVF